MPCYRCGVRQVDPVRGPSPWQRGVRADEQVLICPGCQAAADWKSELDRCQRCGSVRLVRRLGEVECRECGFVVPPEERASELDLEDVPETGISGTLTGAASPGSAGAREGGVDVHSAVAPASGRAPGLAEEVALALERVLGRASKPAAQAGSPYRV